MVEAIFVHLPKTAGTSFYNALAEGFGAGAVSPPFIASFLTSEDVRRLQQYRVVSGHISMQDVDAHFPHAQVFTILRNPVERCISWYYFARAVGESSHSDVRRAQSVSIEEFFRSDASVLMRNLYNRQTRQLGGHALDMNIDMDAAYQKALETLKRCVWVGRQETLLRDFEAFKAIFPEMATCELPRLNQSIYRRGAADIPGVIDRIRALNRHDLKLVEANL